ncbi:uncharacterized protein BDW43DRAFT_305054 [Aspergillus alliaceus]|uniref:uncharacterized protein n=1 Tax=Petromyces alliaceus TaxID=209559 RepID=UPI0012A4A8FB|nr:uncharacterized protein BDW43DRAFT_305054 [Aspergillus alliaceus]KAB8226832.1 hypothetical protein BDW43DRAFT_305054 [Aspergillus alliaceus]
MDVSTQLLDRVMILSVLRQRGQGSWTPISHLPYLQNSSKYAITAVCNSSIESGNKAVESMCDFNTVDLVVCVVIVFSHYKLVKPANERGKGVYVEWPLCTTTEESKALTQLAKEEGIKTITGFQSRVGHVHSTLHDLLDGGRIGRVLATHIIGSSTTAKTGNRLDQR